jgi:nucleotide-binding universal stress UspA family protein
VITPGRILVATDFSEASGVALEEGRQLAATFSAKLYLLHVVAEPLREAWIGFTPGPQFVEWCERLEADARVRLERGVPQQDVADGRIVVATAWGDPADEILRYAASHDIDLIVCGTHGRRGWNHALMGSVAERVVRFAPCPVLTVHAAADQMLPAKDARVGP